MVRRASLALLVVAALAQTSLAHGAPSDGDRARALYDAAVQAAESGEPGRAARLFAEADRMAPHPVALKSALKSVLEADLPALGMELVERAATRELGAESAALAVSARARFESRAGRLLVECPARGCRARLDGAPVELDTAVWVDVGKHAIEGAAGGGIERVVVEVDAGATETVSLRLPDGDAPLPSPGEGALESPVVAPPAQSDGSDEGEGAHPAVFFVGLGVAALLGGLTLASAVDTKDQHDDFDHTRDAAEAGEGAQLRTNVLFLSTLVTATATVVVGAFAVDWGGDREAPGGAEASVGHGVWLRGSF